MSIRMLSYGAILMRVLIFFQLPISAGGGLNGSVPGAGGQCLTGHCYHHHYHHLHYMPHPHQHQAPAGGLQPPGRTNHQIDLSAPNPSSRSQHHTHNQQGTNSHHQQHHKQYR